MERLTLPVEWKAADDTGGLVGYASTFGNVDLGGDVVVRGAFKADIPRIKAEGIPLLADHEPSTRSVLGTIYDAAEDSHGLRIKAKFASTPRAQEVRTLLLEGHLSKMSIGYETIADAFEERDGRTVRLLRAVKLWEVSCVVFAMNPQAAVTAAKTAAAADVPSVLRRLDDELRLAALLIVAESLLPSSGR